MTFPNQNSFYFFKMGKVLYPKVFFFLKKKYASYIDITIFFKINC